MAIYYVKERNFTPLNRERYSRRNPNKKGRLLGIGAIIAGTALSFFIFTTYLTPQSTQAKSLNPLSETTEKIFHFFDHKQQPSSQLNQVVAKSLEGTQGTYAVAIKNMTTGESYYLNENRVFYSASLYKLWVAAAVYNLVNQGRLKESDELTKEIPELNDEFGISSEEAEMTEGVISLTVKEALNQMITISHNYAALLLSDRVGYDAITAFLKQNGFTSSYNSPPKTTASDIALYLEKLYTGILLDPTSTTELVTLLKAQQLNNKLPKNLSSDVVMAHKTGELYDFTHDAGIVYADKGNYIIVVLSESDNPAGAEERIAGVSKAVYDYFQTK